MVLKGMLKFWNDLKLKRLQLRILFEKPERFFIPKAI